MQETWDRIKIYIKNNWAFILIMTLGSIAILIAMSQVVLYADDYALHVYSPGGIESAFNYTVDHYQNWGGGYTSFIVITLLSLPSFIWKIFLAGILIMFVGLSVKMICKNHQKIKWLIALTIWSCIFALSIHISRESIYWLDGGVAYLFSAFQAFLFFYFMYTRLIQKIQKKYDIILLPLIAFFAGWSSAQSGLIAIIMAISVIAWQRFIKKEKIQKRFYISLILCIIGYLIFYFAPGNAARMSEFPEYASYNLIQKIGYRVNSVFDLILTNNNVVFSAAPFFVYLAMGLVAFVDLHTIQHEKSQKLKVLRLCCSIYTATFIVLFIIQALNIPGISEPLKSIFTYNDLLAASQSGTLGARAILPYMIASLAIIANLISSFIICNKNGSPILIISLLMGYLAEFCMIMAPYSPFRTTLYTIVFMWVAIGYLMSIVVSNNIKTTPLGVLLFSIFSFGLSILATVFYTTSTTLENQNKMFKNPLIDATLFVCIISIIGATNYYQIVTNYHRNKIVDEENISRLINYKDYVTDSPSSTSKDAHKVIYLIPPYNNTYGFTGLTGVDWVENSVKTYYNIPTDVSLVYEGTENAN